MRWVEVPLPDSPDMIATDRYYWIFFCLWRSSTAGVGSFWGARTISWWTDARGDGTVFVLFAHCSCLPRFHLRPPFEYLYTSRLMHTRTVSYDDK
jgi:hypothetical protein